MLLRFIPPMFAAWAGNLSPVLAAPGTAGLAQPSAATVELEIPGPAGPLRGSYIAPEIDRPIVLIIPGSGPTDRDGNSPGGISASTYRLLAEALATHGIGSLRPDKRGMFGSASAIPDANDVTIGDYANDAADWVARLTEVTGRSCVWLAGHSEGGLVALAAAEAKPSGLCGLVLLAAPGRPLGTLLREQIAANPANAPLLVEANAVIDRLEAGVRVEADKMTPILATLFAPQVQGFLIDAMARDPAALAGATELPLLVLQGEEDLQVGKIDAQKLAAARPDARLILLPGLTHTLKQVRGNGIAANHATYLDPAYPIDPDVVRAITEFLTADRGGD